MTMQMKGCGLPNVFLMNGYRQFHDDGDLVTAYENIDDLYFAITRQICVGGAPLTSHEVRFLRKRLEKNQGEIGAMLGKTSQAVAKWEKGAAVPLPDSVALRMAWLTDHSPRDLVILGKSLVQGNHKLDAAAGNGYCFEYIDGQWRPIVAEDPHERAALLAADKPGPLVFDAAALNPNELPTAPRTGSTKRSPSPGWKLATRTKAA